MSKEEVSLAYCIAAGNRGHFRLSLYLRRNSVHNNSAGRAEESFRSVPYSRIRPSLCNAGEAARSISSKVSIFTSYRISETANQSSIES